METVQVETIAEPSAEVREAIALLVGRYRCTVKVPVAWQPGGVGQAVCEALDRTWNPMGVRVHIEASSASFPARVRALRRAHGMPPLSGWQDHILFEPEDLDPHVEAVPK